jgi:drug/metabolite transporter (DMT)-like permease
MKRQGLLFYHLLATLIVTVWGVTFISTKVLINSGLTPAQIFTIRFTIAYIGIWIVCLIKGGRDKVLFTCNLKEELMMVFLGVTGGSLYFLTENTALAHTQASNAAFIVCIAPLLTLLLTLLLKRLFKGPLMDGLEDVRLGFPLIGGTVMALTGMFLVVFNGYTLHISPKGDLLAFGAALCWALYSQFMSQMTLRYGTFFATRKVFFYGLITIIPVILLSDNSNLPDVQFSAIQVWGNLLFLSVLASLFCFIGWNRVMAAIGNVTSTNYVYLNPVITLIAAIIILGESMTVTAAIGSAMILGGVILAGVKTKKD